jgi:hypothetical protein
LTSKTIAKAPFATRSNHPLEEIIFTAAQSFNTTLRENDKSIPFLFQKRKGL